MQLKLSKKSSSETDEAAEVTPVSESAAGLVEKFNQRPNLEGITGVELSSTRIAGATVSGGRVKTASYVSLDPNVVADGEILDTDAAGAALAELLDASGLAKRVRIGVASPRVVIRQFQTPVIADRKELDAAIRFQAADHLPMAVDEAILDYQVVGVREPKEAGEQPKFEVVLTAASQGLVEKIIAVATSAGVKLESIDLSAFGLIRAFYPGDAAAGETTGYVHVGDTVNVTLAEGKLCKFTRATPSGIYAAATRLMESAMLTREHAEMWFEHVGLTRPIETIQGEAAIVSGAREELLAMVNQLGTDITAAVDFNNAQPGATRVTRLILVGPATRYEGLADGLAQRTGLPVTVSAPLGALDSSDIDSPDIDLTRIAIAAGLALEDTVIA
ncbi:MAG: pilus assembly protein PilM [Solirubrobacterales bacterium]